MKYNRITYEAWAQFTVSLLCYLPVARPCVEALVPGKAPTPPSGSGSCVTLPLSVSWTGVRPTYQQLLIWAINDKYQDVTWLPSIKLKHNLLINITESIKTHFRQF